MVTWTPGGSINDDTGDIIEPDPVSAIYQAIGSASKCWDDVSKAGEFRSDEAIAICDGLIDYLITHPLKEWKYGQACNPTTSE